MVRSTHIILSLSLALLTLSGAAQSLPSLPQAEEIQNGVLPGGVSYRIVSNSHRKSYADFEIIQLGQWEADSSRAALNGLKHMDPAGFLRRNGIAPGPQGYVFQRPGARVFRFERVPFAKKAVLDSALLMATDIMRLSNSPQRIIISGDVDKASVLRTLEVLALTLPRSSSELPAMEMSRPIPNPVLGREAVLYRIQPQEIDPSKIATPVPLVSELMYREVEYVLQARLDNAMRIASIPYYLKKDGFFTRMYVPEDYGDAARSVAGAVLEGMRAGTITDEEMLWAKNLSLPDLLALTVDKSSFTDAQYLDYCERAYLSGANLASKATVRNFFYRRRLSVERETELLNAYVKEITISDNIGPQAARVQSVSAPSLEGVFKEPFGKRLRVKSEADEPVSGGKLWTLSNGLKVIYKKFPTSGFVHYSLILRGGLPLAEGLEQGQSEYFPAIYDLYGAAGMSAAEWKAALAREGISQKAQPAQSRLNISGEVPVASLETALDALVAMTGKRSLDSLAYKYMARCESIAEEYGRETSVRERVDSTLSPTYLYSSRSSSAVLTPQLLRIANYYYHKRLMNWSGAILVIAGDISADDAKTAVCSRLRAVPMGKSRTVRRPVDYQMRSGTMYLEDAGVDPRLQITMACQQAVSVQTQLASRIAAEAVRDYLADSLIRCGVALDIRQEVSVTPKELVRLTMDFRPVPESALPQDASSIKTQEDYTPILRALQNLNSIEISDDQLKTYKSVVEAQMTRELATPELLFEYISDRYADSKDLCVNWSAALKNISTKDVKKIITALDKGSRVEYRTIPNEQ